MLNDETLRVIQSGTEDEMYSRITDTALFMAAGGYIKESDSILSTLWKYGLPHSRNVNRQDKAFMILWNASGNKPDHIPFTLIDIDFLEKQVRAEQTIDKWATPQVDGDWTTLHGIDLLRNIYRLARLEKERKNEALTLEQILSESTKAGSTNDNPEEHLSEIMQKISAYGQDNWYVKASDKMPSSEKEMLALKMLDKYFSEGKNDENLLLAAELAVKNNVKDNGIQYIRQWLKHFKKFPTGFGLSSLCVCRHIAPLLINQSIADELSLTQEKCSSFVEKMQIAIASRIKNGRTLAYGNMSWKELLKKISLLAINSEYSEEYTKEVKKSGWLGVKKAEEEEIAKTEQRLGIALPEDYKSFLRVTNGFLHFPPTSPMLLPVERIDYIRNIQDADALKQLQEFPSGDNNQSAFSNAIYRTILISNYNAEEWIWLIPPQNTQGDWETWHFAYWKPGEERFPGFRFYIEHMLQGLEELSVITDSKQ